ncbi:hypothetical protein IP88_06900 [alpha proteobacterium AAP81b]|nr:hypothetical protein IP88_06900 [alpha proteobacterium AAP81b]
MSRAERDWYLADWATALGKRQVDFVNDLNWNKARASLLWNGKQGYTREIVTQVAQYLGIRPYELLMRPEEAMAIRDMRDAAHQIAMGLPSPRGRPDDSGPSSATSGRT